MAKAKRESGEGNKLSEVIKDKRALYIGQVSGELPGHEIIMLERGAKYHKTGFPRNHFDLVAVGRVLEKVSRQGILACMNEWTKILKPGGELHIVTPNIRWAAISLMREDFDKNWPAILATLYGTQENEEEYHKSGFTVAMLRGLLEEMGYKIKEATITPWDIVHGEEVMQTEQIYIRAING